MRVCLCLYIYIYVCVCVCVYIYIYIYIGYTWYLRTNFMVYENTYIKK